MLNILADENIAFAEEAFSQFGELKLIDGREITNDLLKNVDVLLVRSVTTVDEKLLGGTNVRFVGTATIGTDHIDVQYLNSQGIHFADAAGCNADAVAEYVFTALSNIIQALGKNCNQLSMGIVGVGNIGGRVEKIAGALGMEVMLSDPPLKRKTGESKYLPLKELEEADIITLHVPLTYEGEDKTFHLFDYERLKKLKNNAIIINTSRGSVIDNLKLIELTGEKKFQLILDVWENEPFLYTELVKMAKIATPHIAGYSLEGKINGTIILYKALCKFLNKQPVWQLVLPQPAKIKINLSSVVSAEESIKIILNQAYDIKKDDSDLRRIILLQPDEQKNYFDLLRKNYFSRREFTNYEIELTAESPELFSSLKAMRFKVTYGGVY